jgi:hypothetical protein
MTNTGLVAELVQLTAEAYREINQKIIAALPPDEFDHGALLKQFDFDVNGLVDYLAERGVYRLRVPYHLSRNRDVYLSEPMDGIPVPVIQHRHGWQVSIWRETA